MKCIILSFYVEFWGVYSKKTQNKDINMYVFDTIV